MTAPVDIVIPTRDRPSLLGEAVASALAQESGVGSVIVVNDGSPLAAGSLPQDPRLRVVENRRTPGAPGARNTGLELVRSPWVVFLDDDDLLDGGFTAKLLEAVEQGSGDPVVLASTGFRIRDRAGGVRERPGGDGSVGLPGLLVQNAVGPTSFSLCRTAAVRAVGGFDERLDAAQDWDLWIRLAGEGTLIRVPGILGTYRIHAGGQISAPDPGTRYVRYLPFHRKRERHPAADQVRAAWASEIYWWGVLMAWTGNVRGAVAAFERAVRHDPGHLKSRFMLCWVQTPLRRAMLCAIYGTRRERMRFEDRFEPFPRR